MMLWFLLLITSHSGHEPLGNLSCSINKMKTTSQGCRPSTAECQSPFILEDLRHAQSHLFHHIHQEKK